MDITQALKLAKMLPTDKWRKAEAILDIDIRPYKNHEKKEELYNAMFLLAKQYNDAGDFKKASKAAWKSYQLNPEGYEILHMFERARAPLPKTAKDIENMIIRQNELLEMQREFIKTLNL